MSECKGQCLCGDVAFTVELDELSAGKCFCEICRKWSAGALVMAHGVHAPQVEKDENLGVYASSEWGERCFCKNCGTNLFWRKQGGGFYGVNVDILANADAFTLGSEIFVDQIPAYHKVNESTKRMTAKEFWEMVAAVEGQ
jgi:hypothetical protein